MKLLRSAVVVAVVVMVTCLSASSFAAEKWHHKDWQEKCQAKIKALKDAAAALQESNPDLAKGLTDLASEKEKKVQEMTEMKAKRGAEKKLLRDSAAVLQKTNPELAEELWDMGERSHMKKMQCGSGKESCPMGHSE